MALSRIAPVITGLVIATSLATAHAVPINYGDFPGGPGGVSFLDVTEDSSTDPTPLYGAPFGLPNSLFFAPLTFSTSSANGGTDFTEGTLTMIIEADAGYTLGTIAFDISVDTTLLGTGTAATFTTVSSMLTLEDLTPGTNGILNDVIPYAPAPPIALPEDYLELDGLLTIDLTGLGISRLMLTLVQTMSAESEMATTSFIQTKTLDIDVTTVPIPEPATISLLAMSSLALLRRRRA